MPTDPPQPERAAPGRAPVDEALWAQPSPVRADSDWLALREPADAAARATDLVEELGALLPSGPLEVHDLGSGTGSMARWLAPRLDRAQHWVLHDRDEDLLREAEAAPPPTAGDGSAVTVATHAGDLTREDFAGGGLITASALLDMLTADEVARLVDGCVRARCPVLLTLSVVGRVELTPRDPFDEQVTAAFNAHQRRTLTDQPLLGPDAADAAADAFVRHGLEVLTRPSPWRLGPDDSALVREWLTGWLDAAYEQQPGLRHLSPGYEGRRRAEAAAGRLSVTVHHQDLLAWEPRSTTSRGSKRLSHR